MTLYLKYRPQTIDELDLTSVRDLLAKIIEQDSMPHAFLFSGPKGAGKTSAARILSKIINCEENSKSLGEPCNKCAQCKATTSGNHVDVVEMDAASNRGIDDIRALRDNVLLAPSMGAKRVYIIDEAHMLTTEAANAFLKTLEEPPEHVVFIFATTEPHKLPITVRSRLFNVPFGRATQKEIVRQLVRVAKGEKIKLEDEVLNIIAKYSDGSFREAVKLFEELVLVQGIVKEGEAKEYFEKNLKVDPEEFLKILKKRDAVVAFKLIEKLVGEGGDINVFVAELTNLLRHGMLARVGLENYKELKYLSNEENLELLEIVNSLHGKTSQSGIPQLPLEIAIAKWCGEIPHLVRDDKVEVRESKPEKKEMKKEEEARAVNLDPVKKLDKQAWARLLNTTRERDAKVEALLRSAEPLGYEDGALNIGVYYQFHKERLETVKIREMFDSVCGQVFGAPVKVTYSLVDRKKKSTDMLDQPLTDGPPNDIIGAAKEMFGN